MANQETMAERMARVRAAKAARKRPEPDYTFTPPPLVLPDLSFLDLPPPTKRVARTETRPTNQMQMSDMIGLMPETPLPTDPIQTRPIIPEPSIKILPPKTPPPITINPTAMDIDDDDTKRTAAPNPPSFTDRAKSVLGTIADAFNGHTPTLASSVGTAAAKLALGLGAALFLAKTSSSSSSNPPNRFTQPSFYL